MKQVLDKKMSDKVSFISFIIPEFAYSYKMEMQEAYFYNKILFSALTSYMFQKIKICVQAK